MKILPIGSVVRICERELVIIGYRPVENNQAVALGYLLLPFPLGYMKQESIRVCQLDKVEEVVFTGYESERGKRFIHILEGVEREGMKADYSEFLEFMKRAKKNLEGKGGQ